MQPLLKRIESPVPLFYSHVMSCPPSPFLAVPVGDWLCSNDLAFAIFDGFPVSPGHVLVTTRRVVETWFEATDDEQAALMALVKQVRHLLDHRLHSKPDGYNVGFNCGAASGQTVPHVHIHVIPRYHGDMADPRGGVRHVIPEKANYLTEKGSQCWFLPARFSGLTSVQRLGWPNHFAVLIS